MKRLLYFSVFLFLFFNTLKAQPDTCKLGVYVHDVYDFDVSAKSFKTDFWVWMLSDLGDTLNNLDFITVVNAKSVNNIIKGEQVKKGKKWTYLETHADIKKVWDTRSFPFDKQVLKISFEHNTESQNLVLTADSLNTNIGDDVLPKDWKLNGFRILEGMHHYTTNFGDPDGGKAMSNYCTIDMELYAERKFPWLMLFKLLTGMYVAFCVSLLALLVPPIYNTPKFSASVGGLWAAVGNKHIMDMYVPSTSGLTLLDTLHNVTFTCIFIIILTAVISLRLQTEEKHETVKAINIWVFRALLSVFILANIFFIWRA